MDKYPTFFMFSDETWFLLRRLVNSQGTSFPMLIHEVPCHDVMEGVLCAMSVMGIVWIIFTDPINSQA